MADWAPQIVHLESGAMSAMSATTNANTQSRDCTAGSVRTRVRSDSARAPADDAKQADK
jgi:hypothetical protein